MAEVAATTYQGVSGEDMREELQRPGFTVLMMTGAEEVRGRWEARERVKKTLRTGEGGFSGGEEEDGLGKTDVWIACIVRPFVCEDQPD